MKEHVSATVRRIDVFLLVIHTRVFGPIHFWLLAFSQNELTRANDTPVLPVDAANTVLKT